MEKVGYSTTTYRYRLYEKHQDWLKMTSEIYNQVQKFYYDIILEREELWELSNQPMMRQLELLTIGARGQKEAAVYPFPYGKVPLYFRRAAINAAIGVSRGYIAEYQKLCLESSEKKKEIQKFPSKAKAFHSSPVFYAGMYRNLTDKDLELKLWNGKKWVWVRYRYSNLGRKLPENGELKSPVLKLTKKAAYLHFPVVVPVEQIRTVKEWLERGEDICAVYFPNNNNLAVCSLMSKKGECKSHYFIKGGNERKERKRQLTEKLKKSKKSRNAMSQTTRKIQGQKMMAEPFDEEWETLKGESKRFQRSLRTENRQWYQKIANLNQYYAHKVSREILNYCVKNQIRVIVVPNYETVLDFNEKRYLKTDNFDWIGRSIIRKLRYKSYQLGIITATVRPHHITNICHICGAEIKKYNEGHRPAKKYYGGQLYLCENGHKGNSSSNSADNVAKNFLRYYQE